MSTRSNIGIIREGDIYEYIYCHYDGYPEHNGNILQKYYKTSEDVNRLIALGSLSSLEKDIGEKIDFNDMRLRDQQCVAYYRDRNDPWEQCIPLKIDRNIMFQHIAYDIEYIYIFENNKWTCWYPNGHECIF